MFLTSGNSNQIGGYMKKEHSAKAGAGNHSSALNTNSPHPQGSTVDLTKAAAVWSKVFGSIEDLFSTVTELPGDKVKVTSHMMGASKDDLKFLAYDDASGLSQPMLAKDIRRGEIVISIKHHSPKPDANPLEALKFQCSHIQIAVGVKQGVMTINNPQGYEEGLFGHADYPMIFVKPTFPATVAPAQAKHYIDNIRTWSVIANTFSVFPGDYNGGDPLSCMTRDQVINFGKALVRALLGDEVARAWLKEPEQRLYCAELAFMVLNLGLYFPLNESQLGQDFVAVQRALVEKQFLIENDNPHITSVDLTIAPSTLVSIDSICAISEATGPFWSGLAIMPFHSADIITQFIQRTIPRQKLGEAEGAKFQTLLLDQIRPMLSQFLSLETQEEIVHFNSLVDRAKAVVEKAHDSYESFRTALEPVLRELATFSLENGMAYIPPHCFLIRATDSITHQHSTGGLLGWEYVGHGIHQSILK